LTRCVLKYSREREPAACGAPPPDAAGCLSLDASASACISSEESSTKEKKEKKKFVFEHLSRTLQV
jgi:hypothetical protein